MPCFLRLLSQLIGKITRRTSACLLLLPVFAANAMAQEIPADLMLMALNHCYPGKTGNVAYHEGDWTIRAGNETYYWAEGRMLPSPIKNRTDIYAPHMFEIYPDTVPLPETFSYQYIEALRTYGTRESSITVDDQHHGFQGVIYGGLNRREIESQLQRINFLGKTISIHRDIAASVRRLDAQIREAGAANTAEGKQIREFLDSIGQIGGYNWREIRGSRRMSYHSWGLAIDIQPKRLNGATIYWMWESSHNDNWMLVPFKARWKPPDRVIGLFEQEGFIWGGKWAMYDNMHFEYRPELHELNRLLASNEDHHSIIGKSTWTASRVLHHIFPDTVTSDQ